MQLAASVGQGKEYLHVQTLVAQLAVEAFDITVLQWLTWPDEIQMHAVLVGPQVHRLARELGPVVDGDRPCSASEDNDLSSAVATFSPLRALSANSVRHSRVN